MRILGLTGSIGTGKTTAAGMFRHEGIPVHDSDQAVHRLYAHEAVGIVGECFPGAVQNGRVDRGLLARIVLYDQSALAELERLIHPLVAESRKRFLRACKHSGVRLVVLDVPLLFETGAEADVDVVLTLTAPYNVQRERVLGRPGMTEEKFTLLLARQSLDSHKKARSHYVIDTSFGYDWVNREIRLLIRSI